MPKDHRSFFERLTGSINADENEPEELEEEEEELGEPSSFDEEGIEAPVELSEGIVEEKGKSWEEA